MSKLDPNLKIIDNPYHGVTNYVYTPPFVHRTGICDCCGNSYPSGSSRVISETPKGGVCFEVCTRCFALILKLRRVFDIKITPMMGRRWWIPNVWDWFDVSYVYAPYIPDMSVI